MFMFMRKFRKNFKGDSLIEVITAFAIVSIVGLITVSGVVTSGRIKVQTNHIKNASYIADEALQEQSMYENMASDSVKIYNAADYNISTKSANTGSSPILTKSASKFSASGTDGDRTQGYKYYKMGVGSDTPNNPSVVSSGNGKFGMSGQWGMRFYIDPTVQVPDKFYIELEFTNGYPGESAQMEANNITFSLGGTHQDVDISNGWHSNVSWTNAFNNYAVRPQSYYIPTKDESGKIISISGLQSGEKNISFPDSGELSFLTYVDISNNDKKYRLDFIDLVFNWSCYSSYGIKLNIIDAEDNKYELASDGTGCVSKIKVYKRSSAFKEDCEIKTLYGSNSDYKMFGNENNSTINEKNIDSDRVADYDDEKYYIYFWKKGDPVYGGDGVWNEDFMKENIKYMLLEDSYGNGLGYNSLLSNKVYQRFREYLRVFETDYYSDYCNWINFTKDEKINADEQNSAYTTLIYYLYYMLDVKNISSSEHTIFLDKNIKIYAEYVSSLINDNSQDAYVSLSKIFYWWKYDRSYLDDVKTITKNNGEYYGTISSCLQSDYMIASWQNYMMSKLKQTYYKPDGNAYSDFASLCEKIQTENVNLNMKKAYKYVYDYFVNKEQASQRETNYANFKKDCTYTNEQISHLQNAFDTIKSMVESDAVKYANAKCSEDYLVKEMIIYVYNPSKYNEISEQLKSSQQGIDMTLNTRFNTQVYKDNFPQEWDAYSQSVLK